jgi:hypothetical protein
MAKTDWSRADVFQNQAPHTFNALQHLVMAMAKVVKYQGKKSLFGKDKGLDAYKLFEDKLRDTVFALVLDDAIDRNSKPSVVRETLIEAISAFEQAFPNWRDAYSFAGQYLVVDARAAEGRIRAIMA